LTKQRFRAMLVSGSLFLLVAAATAGSNVVVGRVFGESGLGDYASILNIGQIGALLTGTALGLLAITSLPQLVQEGRPEQARAKARELLGLCLVGSFALAAVAIPILTPWFGVKFAITAALVLVAISFQNVTRDTLRGLGSLSGSYFVLMVAPVGIILLSVGFGEVAEANSSGVYGPLLAAYGLALIVGVVVLYKISSEGAQSKARGSERWKQLSTLLGPAVAIAASQSILSRTDVVILRALSDAGEAGEMSAASTVASLAGIGLGASNAVYVPRLSGSTDQLQRRRLFKEAQVVSGLFALAMIAFLALATNEVFALYGNGFEKSPDLFRVLAIGKFVSAATGPVAYLGIAAMQSRTVARITILAATVNITLDVAVVHRFGAMGLAYVTASVAVVMNLTLLVFARRRWLA